MALIGWIDTETDLSDWPDTSGMDADALERYLQAAYEQCVAYAPALAEGAPVPGRYVLAQLMQARALYRSVISGGGDTIGQDGFTVTVYPMDRTVKNLLRPRTGRPVVL